LFVDALSLVSLLLLMTLFEELDVQEIELWQGNKRGWTLTIPFCWNWANRGSE
jgi:hypothetical protein